MYKKRLAFVTVCLVAVLLVFASGFATSYFIDRYSTKANQPFPLLAKRTQTGDPNDLYVNFSPLRTDIEEYISNLNKYSSEVSVYFEYLPTGVSINVNESNESIGASLMKVPAVMTLYQLAEEGKIDLDKEITIKKEWLNDEYGTLYQKGAGYQITAREAARLAMKDSDNTAILLVFDQLNQTQTDAQRVMKFLDVEYEINSDDRVLIGARSYSSVLKCLYLACYNSKEASQEILSYLTESTFDDRLTKYLPDTVDVAHKIGTFSTVYQSDCGVFYVPERNYLLCVMVKGDDPEASQIIASISSKVYTYVNEKVTTTEPN